MLKKVILWGMGEYFQKEWPCYQTEMKKGNIEILGIIGEDDTFDLSSYSNKLLKIPRNRISEFEYDYLVIASRKYFFQIYREARSYGVNKEKIIDGMVFMLPAFDFEKFLLSGQHVFQGIIGNATDGIVQVEPCAYPQYYTEPGFSISVGVKSYIVHATVQGRRYADMPISIRVGNYSAISWDLRWEVGINGGVDYRSVSIYPSLRDESPAFGGAINIGSDVWIGKGSILKSVHPQNPLSIGDGAIVAADSVVVKNVPPFAIVGGNPAIIIKYRFTQDVIEIMQRIRWWEWEIEQVAENISLFSDVKKFVERFGG